MHVRHERVWRRSASLILVLVAGIAATRQTGLSAQEATFYSGPVAPLTAAVWQERLDEVRRLLTDGANPDWPDGKNGTGGWVRRGSHPGK